MDDLIQRLDNWLQSNRPEYYAQLLPGLSDEEISNFERSLNVELPLDFKSFYKWKNGQKDDYVYSNFIHNLSWLKAEYAIERSFTEPIIQEDGYFFWDEESQKDPLSAKLVAFLTDSAINTCFLDLAGLYNGKKGQIISWGETYTEILHESFYKWLETVVIAFEKNMFVENEDEELQSEKGVYESFLSENNPGYPKFF